MATMMMRGAVCGLLWGICAAIGSAQDVSSLLLHIKAVGKEGAGNVEAGKAFKELVRLGPGVVPEVLGGMDDASPVAVNWLRAAVESIQDKAIAKGDKLPSAKIDAFLKDTRHSHAARRLAYECLVRQDPATPGRLLPKMLDDPAPEMRRDAVEVQLRYGKVGAFESSESQKKFYQDLLKHARDRDQVNAICAVLKQDFLVDIDPIQHFGFITRWNLIGPFDNVKGVGFNNVYPPEKAVDVTAIHVGKGDEKVRWQEHTTTKKLGVVDINEAIGKLKGSVVYGHVAVDSKTERPVEIRAGSNNAVRIYLNGKEIYSREEYHHGMEMDQHVGKGVLKAGRNEILIKVCQNEQTDSWAQLWSFQLRVCDHLGGAVPLTNVTEKVK